MSSMFGSFENVENCREHLVYESLGFMNTFGIFPTSIHEFTGFI